MADDQDDQQTGDDQSATQTTESDQQTSQDQPTAQGATQTTDDQGADQAIQIDQDTVQQALVSQDNQQSQGTSGSTLDWHDVAKRAIAFLQSDTSDAATRTKCMLNHILDESHGDGYISKDFYNVKQTAGGLPPNTTMVQFLAAIMGRLRNGLTSSSFDTSLSDDDFRTAVMSFDSNIRQHITFLNGVVHQAAPGKVHVALWNLILDSLKDPNSLYKCYTDYLVDARRWPFD
jgi:hypothetical protein